MPHSNTPLPPIQNGKADADDCLEVLGQQPVLNIYTLLLVSFPLKDDASHAAIVEHLTKGLERLAAGFPWVAGQTVLEGAGEKHSGVYKIKPYERTPTLVVRDLRQDAAMPTMDQLQEARFPMAMMDSFKLAPPRTYQKGAIPGAVITPVFMVQANFISGGLLLMFAGHHNVFDMTGQGHVISLFAKACRNEPFTSTELHIGNVPRRNLIPLLDDSYEPGPELDRQRTPEKHNILSVVRSEDCVWANFAFSPLALSELKADATKSAPSSVKWVSTDDALTALVWQSVVRCRLSRLDKSKETKLARSVDVRSFLDIPHKYPGVMASAVCHRSMPEQLAAEPLGSIASKLRTAIDPSTSGLAFETRALATFLHRSPDKTAANVTAGFDREQDLLISSWAKVDAYRQDFGPGLGYPVSVRRPQKVPMDSLAFFVPKAADGEMVVSLCLKSAELAKLREDRDFTKYASYIG